MKKNNHKFYLLITLLAFVFSACEEVIDVDLESTDPALVAEGIIEPGKPVWLQLSHTTDYFSEEESSFEDEANVYISDENGNVDTLYFDGDGMYRGTNIIGEVGNSYTISFYQDNDAYQASSSLLPASDIVNVWFEESSMQKPGEDEKSYEIHVEISNDTQQDNFYLFKFFINGELEDESYSLANSNYYPEEKILDFNPFRIDFELDEEVEVIVYRIDEDNYNYFSQLNDLTESGPGGSSTPYNPQSNFGENVLGYFSAWSYDKVETVVK